ncbi:hypothetical protein RI367_000635 [Sorochytrium milnesiophthora]
MLVASSPYIQLGYQGCLNAVAAAQPALVSCQYIALDESSLAFAGLFASLLAAGQYDHYVCLSFQAGAVITQLAPQYPNNSFSIVDASIDPPVPNVSAFTFTEDEAGYLAGIVAGVFTQRKRVGVISGIPVPPVLRYRNGYLNGVMSVCQDCVVFSVMVPDFDNETMGAAAGDGIMQNNIDVLFGAAGLTGSTSILEAARNAVWAIGVDGDESKSTFSGLPEAAYLLTSAIKKVDVAVQRGIQGVLTGNRGGSNKILDLSLDGVGLAPYNMNGTGNFSQDVLVPLKSTADQCITNQYLSRQQAIQSQLLALKQKIAVTNVLPSGSLQQLSGTQLSTWYDIKAFGEAPPLGVQGHTATYVGNNTVLLYGGQDSYQTLLADVRVLDYDFFQWRRLPSPANTTQPQSRRNHAAMYDASLGRLLIYGGLSSNSSTLSDMWSLDIKSGLWTPVAPAGGTFPPPRIGFSFTSTSDALYIQGGILSDDSLVNEMWKYSLTSNAWTQLSNMKGDLPLGKRYTSLVTINSTTLALFGGSTASNIITNTLQLYDIPSKTWTTVQPSGLAPALEGPAGLMLDGIRVLFVGGRTTNGFSNLTLIWNAQQNAWSQSLYGTLPVSVYGNVLVSFNQSAKVNACQYPDITNFQVCIPAKQPVVLSVGGVSPSTFSGTMVSIAAAIPPLPPLAQLDISAVIIVCTLAGVGILTGILCIAGVLKHRKRAIIKAANVPLCIIVLIGSIMVHVGLIVSTYTATTRIGLLLTSYLMSAGFNLVFSSLAFKTIFSSIRRLSSRRKPPRIFRHLGALFVVNLGCNALWFFLDATPMTIINFGGQIWAIRSINYSLASVIILPILLVIVWGAYMSFRTRNVQSEFNESQYIAVSTYATFVTLIVVITITVLLDAPMIVYIISSLSIFLIMYGVVATFFGGKFLLLFMESREKSRRMFTSSMLKADREVQQQQLRQLSQMPQQSQPHQQQQQQQQQRSEKDQQQEDNNRDHTATFSSVVPSEITLRCRTCGQRLNKEESEESSVVNTIFRTIPRRPSAVPKMLTPLTEEKSSTSLMPSVAGTQDASETSFKGPQESSSSGRL